MLHLHLFTDASVNVKLQVGYGAYLILGDVNAPVDSLKNNVHVKRFEQTSSTKLELQTLLWALNDASLLISSSVVSLKIYTDSQNIIQLPERRARLEKNNYFSVNHKRLNHYELYEEFYRSTAKFNCDWVKVLGHQPSSKKNEIEKIFGIVDQASRLALRNEFSQKSS